jgi:hypothetical protein
MRFLEKQTLVLSGLIINSRGYLHFIKKLRQLALSLVVGRIGSSRSVFGKEREETDEELERGQGRREQQL